MCEQSPGQLSGLHVQLGERQCSSGTRPRPARRRWPPEPLAVHPASLLESTLLSRSWLTSRTAMLESNCVCHDARTAESKCPWGPPTCGSPRASLHRQTCFHRTISVDHGLWITSPCPAGYYRPSVWWLTRSAAWLMRPRARLVTRGMMEVQQTRTWAQAITVGDALLRTAAERPQTTALVTPAGRWTSPRCAERASVVAAA